MIWKLLADEQNTAGQQYMLYIMLALILVLIIFFWFRSGKKSKQSQKEYMEQLEALGPGNKVKTVGGICGIVVEVCEDNTIVMETGSEQSGKSYIKVSKEQIWQTDAKGPTQIAREEAEALKRQAKEAKKGEQPAQLEEPKAEPQEETKQEPQEENK